MDGKQGAYVLLISVKVVFFEFLKVVKSSILEEVKNTFSNKMKHSDKTNPFIYGFVFSWMFAAI